MPSDVVATAGARHLDRARRRLIAASAFLTFLALCPRARNTVLDALQQLFRVLLRRLQGLRQPAMRKDFLSEAPLRASNGARNAANMDFVHTAVSQRHSSVDPGSRSRSSGGVELSQGAARFGDFGAVLPLWLAEGLRRGRFDGMKPIQQKVLPVALAGQDVVGIAPTGSGKTLAFLVPALVHAAGQSSTLRASDGPIVLVLAPTRELAVQIGSVADDLMKPSRENAQRPMSRERDGFNSAVLYGGPRRSDQLQTLQFQRSTHLVVATPGRLLDFLRSGAFTLRRVSFFVLDEGDRMLDYGFEPDVAAISAQIRPDRQMLFFSATWPPEVEGTAKRLCSKGQVFQRVSAEIYDEGEGGANGEPACNGDQMRRLALPGHAGITLPPREIQQVVEVISGSSDWSYSAVMDRKIPVLLRFLEDALGGELGPTPGKALIFVSTRNAAEELGVTVARYFGLDRCGVMHGARKQDQREATLKSFREGRLSALVATDVLGRGVDIAGVSHVIVFDMPNDIETYVHRVGRTGRNGQPGTSIAFYEPQPWCPDLAHELAEVLRACGQTVPEGLAREERKNMPGDSDCWGAWAQDATSSASLPTAPALEDRGSPGLATAEELGVWHADGARVWGYSANGGVSEQGRLELRERGLLRTTWTWGEWALVPAAPHCPPPSRPCPPVPLEGIDVEQKKANIVDAERKETQQQEQVCDKPPASVVASHDHLAFTWNGVTDIVALDATGTSFELVSRNGRPAHTYKKKTLGRALPGITL